MKKRFNARLYGCGIVECPLQIRGFDGLLLRPGKIEATRTLYEWPATALLHVYLSTWSADLFFHFLSDPLFIDGPEYESISQADPYKVGRGKLQAKAANISLV